MDDYKPNNPTDQIKHPNLETLAKILLPETYVEFHAGEGIYDGYRGSSLRVLDILQNSGQHYEAFLHEKDDKRRRKLRRNTRGYNRQCRREWQRNVNDYIRDADNRWLFLLDPTHNKDYEEMLQYIPQLCQTGASMFLYVPETAVFPKHTSTVQKLYNAISSAGRNSTSTVLDVPKGFLTRKDHFITV